MKKMLVSISIVIAVILSGKPIIAGETMTVTKLKSCDLGPKPEAVAVCASVRVLVKFAVAPKGDAETIIAVANDSVEQARLASIPGLVLVQMMMPSLIADARLAEVERWLGVLECEENSHDPYVAVAAMHAIYSAARNGLEKEKVEALNARMKKFMPNPSHASADPKR